MDNKSKTYGLSPGKLAELLNIGSRQNDPKDQGKGLEKAEKLKEMLWQVPDLSRSNSTGIPVIPENLGNVIGLLAGEPVEDVLLCPGSDLSKLRKIKDIITCCLNRPRRNRTEIRRW